MATSNGYLAIDLKPDTPNDKRLWPNVFEQTNKAPTVEKPYFYYSEKKPSPEEQTVVESRSHLNFRKPGHCQSYPLTDLMEDMAYITAHASCNECSLLFKTFLTCKIMFAIGVIESLAERDPG